MWSWLLLIGRGLNLVKAEKNDGWIEKHRADLSAEMIGDSDRDLRSKSSETKRSGVEREVFQKPTTYGKQSVWGFEGIRNKYIPLIIILDSSMVEHSAVNRVVVGSSPTRGVFLWKEDNYSGSMVKRLRHRPFTAVTRVRFPLESLAVKLIQSAEHLHADVAQLAEQLICNQQVIGSSPIIGFLYLDH